MGKTLFCGCLRMKYLLIFIAIMLSGCEDRYRYKCQNPDYFHAEECQKPKCLFTQQCPEYLVAPILEKKVNDVQQPENKPNN
jgi:hypothetical protein